MVYVLSGGYNVFSKHSKWVQNVTDTDAFHIDSYLFQLISQIFCPSLNQNHAKLK